MWRSSAHARSWIRSLELDAFPRIGGVPVSEVTSADVLEILTPIWHTKASTARSVHQRIRVVLEWAIAMDWRTDNPCDRLLPVLSPQRDVVVHRKAMPHREVSSAIERVRAADPAKVDTLAFEFLVLTAARSGEVRGAAWSEIDKDARVWTVPASRMKTARDQRVPLCGRALEILDAARRLGGGESPIVFVTKHGQSLGSERLTRLLKRHRIAAVPHGFRSSFRDWAAEETNHPREVVEAALAHVVQNKVERTEIDRDEGVWTVPARRTKANREHRVPLCGRALEILDGARTLVKGTSPYLFPNRLGKQLEEKQLRRMLGKHKIAAVPHGFRSSFRDWAAEETNHPREVIEAALAHVVQNRVEAAYRRTDLFERRRLLMDDWAAYLAQGTTKDSVATRNHGASSY